MKRAWQRDPAWHAQDSGQGRSKTFSRRFAAIRWAATTRPRKARERSPLEDTRPYVYGDSLANLEPARDLKNAYIRQGGGVPIRLSSEDYVVHETEYQTRCATVVLIDMSGSMGRYGKYYTTKKVALALQAMVRAEYPQDSLQMIGFYTFASLMTERQLLNSAPKPVSMFDSRINLRFDLDQAARAGSPALHQYSRRACGWLAACCTRQPAANKQIIVITDGEPTAHIEGREVVLIYPPAEKTAKHTLGEVEELRNAGDSRIELRFDRGLLLSRSGELRRGDGPRVARAWPLTARPMRSGTLCLIALWVGGGSGGMMGEERRIPAAASDDVARPRALTDFFHGSDHSIEKVFSKLEVAHLKSPVSPSYTGAP